VAAATAAALTAVEPPATSPPLLCFYILIVGIFGLLIVVDKVLGVATATRGGTVQTTIEVQDAWKQAQ
jgi:hypothetical protein